MLCESCRFEGTTNDVEAHRLSGCPERPIRCCGKVFPYKEQEEHHMREHRIKCGYHAACFMGKAPDVEEHMKYDCQDKPMECCGVTFTKRLYVSHQFEYHKNSCSNHADCHFLGTKEEVVKHEKYTCEKRSVLQMLVSMFV